MVVKVAILASLLLKSTTVFPDMLIHGRRWSERERHGIFHINNKSICVVLFQKERKEK